ncbi:hypothetical protein INT43_000783 [Umbelopsis isabellina]|uniref:Protein YOP1 n=1 Tax=Mortierella isabellina TaxID=91625 RepID=A0A8H7Q3I0_MORIS|nr:hypothetical protein INT43_000783 [Umbelopsis isabellina]
MTEMATKQNKEEPLCHATSIAVENAIKRVETMAPINLTFFTRPMNDMTVTRIKQLESLYACSRITRFLLRKGVHPIGLFTVSTAALALAVRRLYRQSSYLIINTLGVAYPTWQCLKLLRKTEEQPNPSAQMNADEYKSWLTYWLLYGSLQVLDNWAPLLCDLMPYYNIYKIVLLYWAQNPQSKGANVLYHVLKPIQAQPSPIETSPIDIPQPYTLSKSMSIETIVKQTTESVPTPYETQYNSTGYANSFHDENDEELTLTISSGGPAYGLMNGYTPSLSSEREDETDGEDETDEEDSPDEPLVQSNHSSISALSASPKYNMLMHVANETPAW